MPSRYDTTRASEMVTLRIKAYFCIGSLFTFILARRGGSGYNFYSPSSEAVIIYDLLSSPVLLYFVRVFISTTACISVLKIAVGHDDFVRPNL